MHYYYRFIYKRSETSLDQQGHGCCVLAESMKLTWEIRTAKLINEAFSPMNIAELRKMSKVQARILLCKNRYSFVAGDLACGRCKDIMKKTYDTNEIVDFNENIA